MSSLLEGFDNHLDPANPADALIIAQRGKYFEWQKEVAASESAPRPDRADWEIEPVSIYESYGIHRLDIASLPARSSLANRIQDYLVEAYHRRGLYFPQDDMYAIANPDKTDRSDKELAYQGVLPFFSWGYDLRVPIVLTKAKDGAQFDFFFALMLLKVPAMELDNFLNFHLAHSFADDLKQFKRFLDLLICYIEDELSSLKHGDTSLALTEQAKSNLTNWQPQNPGILNVYEKPPGISRPIQADISPIQFKRALNALGSIEGKDGCPIITKEDLAILKARGPFIWEGGQDKIRLHLSRNDKTKFYHFVHWLWEKFTEGKNRGKESFADYAFSHFSNFETMKRDSLLKSMVTPAFETKRRFNEIYEQSRE